MALLSSWLVLLCYIRSGWNEANANDNDPWITLLAFAAVRAIPLDRKGNSSVFPVLDQFPVKPTTRPSDHRRQRKKRKGLGSFRVRTTIQELRGFGLHNGVTRDLSQQGLCHHKLARRGLLDRNSFRVVRDLPANQPRGRPPTHRLLGRLWRAGRAHIPELPFLESSKHLASDRSVHQTALPEATVRIAKVLLHRFIQI